MVLAVAKALEDGARSVICASTGNTSASAAAYAAAAGLECVVVLPAGKIAVGKLLQALVFGARVIVACAATSTRRCGSSARCRSRTSTRSRSSTRSTRSGSRARRPARSRSCDDLGRAPDVLAIPVGNAGNISAYWRGFREYREAGRADAVPRDVGLPGRRRRAARRGPPGRPPRDRRDRDPDRQPGLVDARDRRRATRRAGGSPPSPTTRSSRAHRDARAARGRVLRAVVGGVGRRRRQGGPRRASSTRDATRRVRPHRQRAQGPDDRRGRDHGRGGRGGRRASPTSARALGWW